MPPIRDLSPVQRRTLRHAVRSSRTPRRSATVSSSRSARRATTDSGACSPFSAARSRTGTRARSWNARSSCSSRKWKAPRWGRRRNRERLALSVLGRMDRPRLAMSRETSSARRGGVTAANAHSCRRTGTDAPSVRSWSSTTSNRMRTADPPRSRTSRSGAGATINMKRSWSSGGATTSPKRSPRLTHRGRGQVAVIRRSASSAPGRMEEAEIRSPLP
jgi:hypothetical protein